MHTLTHEHTPGGARYKTAHGWQTFLHSKYATRLLCGVDFAVVVQCPLPSGPLVVFAVVVVAHPAELAMSFMLRQTDRVSLLISET